MWIAQPQAYSRPVRIVGVPVCMRAHKVGGESAHARAHSLYVSALTTRAALIIANSMIYHLPESPGSTLMTGICVAAPNCVDICIYNS